MADYVSALNGQQMDAALMDMALHNSEAWAVGTRNGYEVESDDITWENNAKYYASVAGESSTTATTAASSASESASTASSAATAAASDATRAEDAADRAEAIVGGQFVSYGQTQGLTDAQKLQARANISAGASNSNLLDNPFFTVNQRGFTSVSYTSATTPAYCVDRWLFGGVGSLTYNSDKSITVNITSGNYGGLTQRFDPMYKGLKVTVSIMLTNGTVVSTNGQIPSASGLNRYYIALNGSTWEVLLRSDGSTWWIELRCNVSGATATIRAVKLELGSYSTLANDVPPDYGEELRKCQRYFLRIPQFAPTILGYGTVGSGGSGFTALIPTPVPMRPVTSISGTGAYNIRYGSGAIATIASVTLSHTQPNGVVVTGVGTFTGNAPFILFKNNTGYTDLSADL